MMERKNEEGGQRRLNSFNITGKKFGGHVDTLIQAKI